MAKRGPRIGYKTKVKGDNRIDQWSALAFGLDLSASTILVFLSEEGLELPILFDQGAKAENIICVERDPNVLARAKWYRKHPKINVYPHDLNVAIPKIVKDGFHIDYANLDFCCQLCVPLVTTLVTLRDSGLVLPGTRLSVTMINGREQPAVIEYCKTEYPVEWLNSMGERMNFAMHVIAGRKYSVTGLGCNKYQSYGTKKNGTTALCGCNMQWSAAEFN